MLVVPCCPKRWRSSVTRFWVGASPAHGWSSRSALLPAGSAAHGATVRACGDMAITSYTCWTCPASKRRRCWMSKCAADDAAWPRVVVDTPLATQWGLFAQPCSRYSERSRVAPAHMGAPRGGANGGQETRLFGGEVPFLTWGSKSDSTTVEWRRSKCCLVCAGLSPSPGLCVMPDWQCVAISRRTWCQAQGRASDLPNSPVLRKAISSGGKSLT